MIPAATRSDSGDGLAITALAIEGLAVSYRGVPAVDSVDLTVAGGQVVALIGETGSGKSSVALASARLLNRSASVDGRVTVAGVEVTALGRRDLQGRRSRLIGYIPQDSMAALNPVVKVGRQISELFRVHRGLSQGGANAEASRMLALTQIADPGAVARLYPHQLSGGMRQRVMIAMAVALSPPLLIADEATTALDVTTQAEILTLVRDLRSDLGMGVLWITHDMGVVAELADSVAVMYAGRIVEQATVFDLFDEPAHPYTKGLLETRRDVRSGKRGGTLYQIPGAPASLDPQVAGCPFAPRCQHADATCENVAPERLHFGMGRTTDCHHPNERALLPQNRGTS